VVRGASAWRPAISPDGKYVAFSVRQHEQRLLYVMQADGTNARIVTDLLNLEGAPAWRPTGVDSVGAEHTGVPRLFRIPVEGRAPAPFVHEYSIDPRGRLWPLRCLLGADIAPRFR